MRREISVRLPFLGARNYLQGTTLFACLWSYVPPHSRFVFKMPRFIRSDQICVTVQSPDEPRPPKWDAILDWTSDGSAGLVTAIGLEGSGAPVREPYDEGRIISMAVFHDTSVVLDSESPVEFVPTIVSLQKEYLLRSAHARPESQWIFTRLDLRSLPARTRGLALKNFTFGPGNTTCKSTVTSNGADLGELYFASIARAG